MPEYYTIAEMSDEELDRVCDSAAQWEDTGLSDEEAAMILNHEEAA